MKKRCAKCGEEIPEGRTHSWCKACLAKYERERRAKAKNRPKQAIPTGKLDGYATCPICGQPTTHITGFHVECYKRR